MVKPDQAARILAESQAILERTSHFKAEPVEVPLPELEDPLTRWKREGDEIDRQRAEEKRRLRASEQADQADQTARLTQLQSLLAQYVEQKLQEQRRDILKIVTGALGEVMGRFYKHAAEIEKLKAKRDDGKAKVVDMPNFLQRRKG